MEHTPNPYHLTLAELRWDDDHTPIADAFGDVYFSRDNGPEESRYVFLDHNALTQRWSQLAPAGGRFTIVETGFGTGLNFLLAWQLWQQLAPPTWTLHYLSVEKHPLQAADLARCHQHWPPALHTLSLILQHNYPPLVPGHHRRMLNNSQVCLDLCFGDVGEILPQLAEAGGLPAVDAWFLDGFAPASNPGMWTPALFDSMAQLSASGASFATFTAAGAVKRGLRDAGFEVDKVKGYGRKREMLCGRRPSGATPATPPHAASADPQRTSPSLLATNTPPRRARVQTLPWHQPAAVYPLRHVAVIGAGLAGCSTAAALARRGLTVTVIEREAKPASGASGNPQGILYTKLSPQPGPLNQFTLSSFLYACQHYNALLEQGLIEGELCGVLQTANTRREREHWQCLQAQLGGQHWLRFVDAADTARHCGVALDRPGIFYPQAGWLVPGSVCRAALAHPAIQVITHREAIDLAWRGDEHPWQVVGDGGATLCRADAVVIANSHDASQLTHARDLPLRRIRGQLTYLPDTALRHPPRAVICHEGYLAPPVAGQVCLGASFDLHADTLAIRDDDHQHNLQQLRELAPDLLGDTEIIGGRAAWRCASPDYLPIVGALPDVAAFEADYADLRKDAKKSIDRPGRYHPNLYVNVAHGSRGLTSTPLCAELLASYLCQELRPLPAPLCEHLSPARFVIRDLMRNRR